MTCITGFNPDFSITSKERKMYFTTFNTGTDSEFSILHANPARQYADDLATYEPYVQVTRKPMADEAQTVFSIIKGGSLCAGISSAKTVKL